MLDDSRNRRPVPARWLRGVGIILIDDVGKLTYTNPAAAIDAAAGQAGTIRPRS
jgi:hypothetical protein